MSSEIWKDVIGYEGLYQVSNLGRVKSLKKWDVNKKIFVSEENILKPSDNGNGYLIVGLRKERKRKNHYVHRLVAFAFVENVNNDNYVNHIDYDLRNNNANNLEWCTQKENVHHSVNRMRHRKSVTHTNTGERYIYYRKSQNVYRVVVDHHEYPPCGTLEDATKKRDEILKNGGDI